LPTHYTHKSLRERSLDRAFLNTILWLIYIETSFGWENRENSYKTTKSFIQAIWDDMPLEPLEETVNLCANLPLIMKGTLMDDYNYKESPPYKKY
jgi:uncharacterized protein (DUF2267 family)